MRAFDPDLLRTLVAFADAGTLAGAGKIVGRTPSALTAQMQRLEDMAGVPLLSAVGRGRVLTNAGERLVMHARRILAANEEAWLDLHGTVSEGRIGIGVTQDFAGEAIADPLALFARTHPHVQTDMRVGRSSELNELLRRGEIDLSLTMSGGLHGNQLATFVEPMCWIISQRGLVGLPVELPLAVLDAPCGFRDAAISALERANRSYRITTTSPSLSGLRPVLLAGLAVTVRTKRFVDKELVVAPEKMRLPKLPDAVFTLNVRRGADDMAIRFGTLLVDRLSVR